MDFDFLTFIITLLTIVRIILRSTINFILDRFRQLYDFILRNSYRFKRNFREFIKELGWCLSYLNDILAKRYDLIDYLSSKRDLIRIRKLFPNWRSVTLVIIIPVILVLFYSIYLIVTNYINVWQLLGERDSETAQVEQLKSLVSVGSSLLIFVGTVGSIYWTYRNIKASLEKQVTDRFTAAINQLKSDEPAVQLGGIYALETIAKESEQYHWTIIEILVSLIKYESSKFEEKILKNRKENRLLILINKALEEKIHHKITIVIQAALNVIGRRDTSREDWDQILDLSYCYLCQANLKRAKLKNANLNFSKLNGAELQEADLSGAKLEGAKLKGANFKYANLDKAIFQDAILQEADLTGCSTIATNFTRADLSNANLTNTNLKLANLTEAILISIKGFGRNVDFRTSMEGATYDDETENQITRVKSDFDFSIKGMKKIKK